MSIGFYLEVLLRELNLFPPNLVANSERKIAEIRPKHRIMKFIGPLFLSSNSSLYLVFLGMEHALHLKYFFVRYYLIQFFIF